MVDAAAGLVWNGKHPEDGSELEIIQGAMQGVPYSVLEEAPQLTAPGELDFGPEVFKEIAQKLGLSDEWKQQRHG